MRTGCSWREADMVVQVEPNGSFPELAAKSCPSRLSDKLDRVTAHEASKQGRPRGADTGPVPEIRQCQNDLDHGGSGHGYENQRVATSWRYGSEPVHPQTANSTLAAL